MNEQNITAVINSIFNGCDKHDWQLVRDCLHFEVFLDYFSMNNQPGSKMKATEIIERWSSFLPKFAFTLHFVTNHVIAVDETLGNVGTAFCNGQAIHHLPAAGAADVWITYGTYNFSLIKVGEHWKVISIIFNLLYQQGNESLPTIAATGLG